MDPSVALRPIQVRISHKIIGFVKKNNNDDKLPVVYIMKLSLTLLAIAGPSAAAFAPVTTARVTASTALHATIENTKLIPPKKVEELDETAADLYGQNVQTTYG